MRQSLYVFVSVLAVGCGGGSADDTHDQPDAGGPTASDADPGDPPPPPPPPATSVTVTLEPRSGVSGTQRVNFAVPLGEGWLADADLVRVMANGSELRAARRALATYPDGS